MLGIAGAPFKLVFEPNINVLEATVAMSSAQVFILSLKIQNLYYMNTVKDNQANYFEYKTIQRKFMVFTWLWYCLGPNGMFDYFPSVVWDGVAVGYQ